MQSIRGVKDIFDGDASMFLFITNIASKIADLFSFSHLSVPIIENTLLYKRNLGSESDIISKEIYTFFDKGQNEIALRPEFTAGIVRAFIQNSLFAKPGKKKFFSYGPLFRYDRPQAGRYRQFNQINYEIFGDGTVEEDISTIFTAYSLFNEIFKNSSKSDCILKINSLGSKETIENYSKGLFEFFSQYKSELSQDANEKLFKNPIRILDSKIQSDIEIAKLAPKISTFYTTQEVTRIAQTTSTLKNLKIPFELDENLVRGLDYYTGLVFEIVAISGIGAQSAVLGGGRYDNLVSQISESKHSSNAIGFAGGIERIMLLLEKTFILPSKHAFAILPISQEAFEKSFEISKKLHEQNIPCEIFTDISSNLNKRIEKASKMNFSHFAILGQKEIESGIISFKNATDGTLTEMHFS